MRIGLTGGGSTVEKVLEQAKQAEADGFTSLWYASVVTGDPLVAIALAGRETSSIELGTAVLQTYPCHPLLQANRAASVVDAMGRPGFTIGIGPSHEPLIRNVLGMSYDHPGRSTEEYVRILAGLLRGETPDTKNVTDLSAYVEAANDIGRRDAGENRGIEARGEQTRHLVRIPAISFGASLKKSPGTPRSMPDTV